MRIYDKATGKIRADLICLEDEVFNPEEDIIIFDPMATWKKTKLAGGSYILRELLVPVFQKGHCVYTSPSVMEIRDICQKELDTLWDETRRFTNPQEVLWICQTSFIRLSLSFWRKWDRQRLSKKL